MNIFFRIFDFEFRKCPTVKMSLRPRFDPVQHGLESNFRLTRFSQLVGSACRAPADLNNKLCQVRFPPRSWSRVFSLLFLETHRMLQVLESWPKVMLFFPTRTRRKTEAFSKILNGLVIFCLVLNG